MIRKKDEAKLDVWIANAKRSLVSSFATGVLKDRAAVRAAIIQPWSNGQVEAQITKLKLVKRQMYGRAKIDLLEARLLGTALSATLSSNMRQTPKLTPPWLSGSICCRADRRRDPTPITDGSCWWRNACSQARSALS
jgi:transposase